MSLRRKRPTDGAALSTFEQKQNYLRMLAERDQKIVAIVINSWSAH
jgi:hypothetical protein